MTKVNQSFILNYILLTWCLVACNKLIRSGVRSGCKPVDRKTNSLALSSLIVLAAPDSFINHLKLFIMPKQLVKDNIVYDSINDKSWNMQGFFEVLEMCYEGKPELMAEELVQAVKTMLILKDSVMDDALKEYAVHLLYLRDAVIGILPSELVIKN